MGEVVGNRCGSTAHLAPSAGSSPKGICRHLGSLVLALIHGLCGTFGLIFRIRAILCKVLQEISAGQQPLVFVVLACGGGHSFENFVLGTYGGHSLDQNSSSRGWNCWKSCRLDASTQQLLLYMLHLLLVRWLIPDGYRWVRRPLDNFMPTASADWSRTRALSPILWGLLEDLPFVEGQNLPYRVGYALP